MICPGCGGVVGRDCWNPQECEWISRDMAARHAAQSEVEPLLQRIHDLEERVRQLGGAS
jgi:hypothetical protein